MNRPKHRSTKLSVAVLAVLGTAGALGAASAAQPGVIYNGPVVNVQNSAPAWEAPSERGAPAPAPPQPYLAPELRSVRPAPVGVAPEDDPNERGLSLGGPRIGFSYISGDGYDKLVETVRKAKANAPDPEPGMSQFGWQAEYRFYRNDQGLTALMEFIPLVGGLDQGLALPSLTWLLGLRGRSGLEFGVGPALGLNGAGLMLGAGYTKRLGGINVPFNIAVGRGNYQTTSFAVSTGFNL